jgi:hypothetical protein
MLADPTTSGRPHSIHLACVGLRPTVGTPTMRFSERSGQVGTRPLQRGQMDDRLRNGLWDVLLALLERIQTSDGALFRMAGGGPAPAWTFLGRIWTELLGQPGDRFAVGAAPLDQLRAWYFKALWHQVYDLVEFVAESGRRSEFADECNAVFERERAAYRLVDGRVVELTDEGQLRAIEDVVHATEAIGPVHEHLKTALARLGDRPVADYRNSIKESICAVETMARLMTGMPKATLAEALKAFPKRGVSLHPALNNAWQNIYGYTSDEGGVRHALTGDTKVDLAEAMYMLVSCSAFVSYLIEVAKKCGIDVGK